MARRWSVRAPGCSRSFATRLSPGSPRTDPIRLCWPAARRRLDAHQGASEEQSPPTPEEALIAKADRDSVAAAIDALPLAFKETLVMREINGLSYREIAEATGAPIGTVMSRLARARALMIDKLGGAP